MDTELVNYADALLAGTGTDPQQVTAELNANTDPSTPAAAAVIDGWRAAESAGAAS